MPRVEDRAVANTDRELWRKGDGDGNGMSYYEPSIHVTEQGDIGINVGGTVFVHPVEEWHRLAANAAIDDEEDRIDVAPAWPYETLGRWWRKPRRLDG
jgi:hypothetical protein